MINSEEANSTGPADSEVTQKIAVKIGAESQLSSKEQLNENKSSTLLKELNNLKIGDAKINFLLGNGNENWNTIVGFGSGKATELVNSFLSKLDPNEKTPRELAKLIKLPVKSSFLAFGFISDQVKETGDPKYISEILKKGFEPGGKALSALMLSTILFEQVAGKLKSEQNAELIVDIMQGQAESASLSSLLFSGLIKSFNKNILSRMDKKSSFKLLHEMASRLKDKKLDFHSFPINDLLSKVDANEIKQFNASQILALSNSSMSLDQKELILNKFFAGESKTSISGRWTPENQRQLFRTLLKRHLSEFGKVFSLKEKTESSQKFDWTNLFSGAMRVAGMSASLRNASLGN
ncbi:MAG: hypothetical protein UT13_C0001G0025 [Candidatus Pacebacteria bacterium GW2011_GWF2_38_9]|nr:MAG: hypothetical protein US01_C0001G0025 [candidate division TM6 bacterium GW2011_GWF2_28_16]KKQ08345.1 MAG: hypothetical protein US20_C0019G0002 [Candidatus Pacebacteria bacterium GW2011_GWF1_36_5]KKQ88379.1 MAG: hypothetical protein UT13_C0001G0025 [Candidatus Pacebacteria bacterium GW2011_GWF2_38_9]HAZ72996.1 hypothetical protein [Candidatus Paceibacterota bacterium]